MKHVLVAVVAVVVCSFVVDGRILWQTDHETGDIYDWSYGNGWLFWDSNTRSVVATGGDGQRIFGETIFNSRTPPGDCITTISDEVSRSGSYSMKMEMIGASNGNSQGCRTFRTWLAIDGADGTPLPQEGFYSIWYLIPQEVTTKVWWNVFQFKSSSESYGSEPMLSFNIESDGSGRRSLYVYHSKGRENGCDCLGSCEPVSYFEFSDQVNLPVNEWFHVEAFVRQSSFASNGGVTADGVVKVWVNDVLVVDRTGICTLLRTDARLAWSVNNYSDDIEPADSSVVLYVDDAAISTERLGTSQIKSEPQPSCEGLVCLIMELFCLKLGVYCNQM